MTHLMTRLRCAPWLAALTLTACAGPAIHIEPRATSQEEPLAFDLRDWDWNGSSLEIELRVTNHGERTVVLERGFLALNDGQRSMAPTTRPQTCRIAPHGTRNVYLRYPKVDEGVSCLTIEFGKGALTLDGKQGESLALRPVRLLVGEGKPAQPSK